MERLSSYIYELKGISTQSAQSDHPFVQLHRYSFNKSISDETEVQSNKLGSVVGN